MRKISFFGLPVFYNALASILGICIYIQLTSFHVPSKEEEPYHHTIKQVMISFYNLHLQLERIDLNAYPPEAARKAAQLGIAGMLVFQNNQESYTHQHNDFPILLSEVFANTLKSLYRHLPQAEDMIEKERVKISFLHDLSPKEMRKLSDTAQKYARFISENNPGFSVLSLHEGDHCRLDDSYLFHPLSKSYVSKENLAVYVPESRSATVKISDDNVCIQDSRLRKEAMFVFYTSQQLTSEKKWIAEYWSDDVRGLTLSSVGRWISIANQLACKNLLPAEKLPEIYFKLGITLHDAVTVCWKYKFQYKIARPSDVIRQYYANDWQPYHQNPDFPSFPSGHATIGAAASGILSAYVKETTSLTDDSHLNRNEFLSNPRKYASLSEMAEENAVSRVYMGVHYPMDCSEGLKLGAKIADHIKIYPLLKLWLHVSPISRQMPDYCLTEVSTTYR